MVCYFNNYDGTLSIAIVHKSSLIYIALGVILTLATYHESTPKFRR